MLKIVRLPVDKLSLVLSEKFRFSRPLLRALLYSILIHGVMVISFQIRKPFVEETSTSPTPLVMLDLEEGAATIFTDPTQDEDPRARLLRELHFTSLQPLDVLLPLEERVEPLSEGCFVPPLSFSTVPWDVADNLSPAHHLFRIYPMKLTLHQNLRQLIVTDDVASLFQKATPDTFFVTPVFSEVQPKVEFNVVVDLLSGRIIRSACVKELVDKRLQWLAEVVVKKFRCTHPDKKTAGGTISGKMTLQFAGTFDTLCRVVAWDHIDD